jgi:hypothetical protein
MKRKNATTNDLFMVKAQRSFYDGTRTESSEFGRFLCQKFHFGVFLAYFL